jgi:MFS family permease
LLSGFDATISASTYTVIGSYFNVRTKSSLFFFFATLSINPFHSLQAANAAAWIASAYLIASTSVQPLYGRLSDVWGRRSCFLASVSFFLIGSLLCGFATRMWVVILGRAVQGIGGDGVWSEFLLLFSSPHPTLCLTDVFVYSHGNTYSM